MALLCRKAWGVTRLLPGDGLPARAHDRVTFGLERLDLPPDHVDHVQPVGEPFDLPTRPRRERLTAGRGCGRECRIEVGG